MKKISKSNCWMVEMENTVEIFKIKLQWEVFFSFFLKDVVKQLLNGREWMNERHTYIYTQEPN